MSAPKATTVKLAVATRDRVNAIGEATGQTAEQVVAHALDEYERALFFRAYQAAATADLRSGDTAVETDLWDRTIRDGLIDG
ncbi:MAG: hypothetical protein ACT4QF_08665 [Sporichthyaceae bacterium]